MSSAGRARLVVFDLDGTLVDSSRDIAGAVNDMLERLSPGSEPLQVDEVRSLIGDGARLLVARTLERTGMERPPEQALSVFLDCYRGRLLDTTRLYDGIAEALDALEGDELAVLTNKPGDLSRAILDGLGLSRRFRRVYGGGDLPGKKPDPEGLRRLMAEAGLPPHRTVMVGDSAVDVRTGRAAGVPTVGAAWGFAPQSLRATPPDVLVGEPRALPAAVDRALGGR